MSIMSNSRLLSQNVEKTAETGQSYVITLLTSGRQIEYQEKTGSLLDVLERNRVILEFQCRSGYCGSCRCRMTKGTVVYFQKPLALINDGEVLPCSCLPASDIELDR